MLQAAEAHGASARGIEIRCRELAGLEGPAVAWVPPNHFVVLCPTQGKKGVILLDFPQKPRPLQEHDTRRLWPDGLCKLLVIERRDPTRDSRAHDVPDVDAASPKAVRRDTKESCPLRWENEQVDLGEFAQTELPMYSTLQLRNTSDSNLQVLGAGTSCGCVTVCSFPKTIPSKKAVAVEVRVNPATKVGPTEVYLFVCLKDIPGVVLVPLRFSVKSGSGS